MGRPSHRRSIRYPSLPEHVRKRGVVGALGLFGPGAIIASVTIGSGETLFASRAGAVFGYSLLWFILASAFFKLIQVYTGARYMVLTGEHPLEAWARLPGPRGWFPGLLGAMSIFCFPFWLGALSMMVGTALNWVFGLDTGDDRTQWLRAQLFATGVLVMAVALTLVQSYRVLEKVQQIIVAVLLAAILAGLAAAPVDWTGVGQGLVRFRVPDYPEWMATRYPQAVARETALVLLVIFMTSIGGGTYDYIGYLSFLREKRWGGLGNIPAQEETGKAKSLDTSDGSDEAAPMDYAGLSPEASTGPPAIDTSQSNLAIGRRWLRAPVVDVFTGFACVAIFTMAFNILGASVLHPHKLVPEKFDLLTHQVRFLTQFGAAFKYLYQFGILLAFWGTIYGAFEIYSRTAYECVRPLAARVRGMRYERFRLPVCLYAGIGGLLLAWLVQDPLVIVRPIAPVAMLTCGIWCFAMIWSDRRFLPGPLRMNVAWLVLNAVAGAVMTGCGLLAWID